MHTRAGHAAVLIVLTFLAVSGFSWQFLQSFDRELDRRVDEVEYFFTETPAVRCLTGRYDPASGTWLDEPPTFDLVGRSRNGHEQHLPGRHGRIMLHREGKPPEVYRHVGLGGEFRAEGRVIERIHAFRYLDRPGRYRFELEVKGRVLASREIEVVEGGGCGPIRLPEYGQSVHRAGELGRRLQASYALVAGCEKGTVRGHLVLSNPSELPVIVEGTMVLERNGEDVEVWSRSRLGIRLEPGEEFSRPTPVPRELREGEVLDVQLTVYIQGAVPQIQVRTLIPRCESRPGIRLEPRMPSPPAPHPEPGPLPWEVPSTDGTFMGLVDDF